MGSEAGGAHVDPLSRIKIALSAFERTKNYDTGPAWRAFQDLERELVLCALAEDGTVGDHTVVPPR